MENHGRKEAEDIAGKVQQAVSEILESLELGQLNQTVRETAGSVFEEAKRQMEQCRSKAEDAAWRRREVWGRTESKSSQTKPVQAKLSQIRVNWKGRVSGILFTVFGSIGMGVFGILSAVLLSLAAVSVINQGGWWLGGFSGIIAAGFGIMLARGIGQNKRIGRLKEYIKELKYRGRSYCQVEELSKSCGRKKKFVQKDLKKILELGMLPDARMDDEASWIMLDEETYRQYRMSRESLKQKQEEQKERDRTAEQEWDQKISREEGQEEDPLEAVIRQGERYMETLDSLREAMPDAPIREKLLRLDRVLERLFEGLKKHPEQLPDMEKFMEYYLPTTVKMVSAYGEFAMVEFPGDNINGAKAEIEQAMDTINRAFEKMLDDLYGDAAFDIITDAAVLKTMLAGEGMTESDFRSDSSRKS